MSTDLPPPCGRVPARALWALGVRLPTRDQTYDRAVSAPQGHVARIHPHYQIRHTRRRPGGGAGEQLQGAERGAGPWHMAGSLGDGARPQAASWPQRLSALEINPTGFLSLLQGSLWVLLSWEEGMVSWLQEPTRRLQHGDRRPSHRVRGVEAVQVLSSILDHKSFKLYLGKEWRDSGYLVVLQLKILFKKFETVTNSQKSWKCITQLFLNHWRVHCWPDRFTPQT